MASPDKDKFVEALTQPDAIMTSDVAENIKGYIAHGGDPASLIQMLSGSYEGFAQMANLLQQWLDFTSVVDSQSSSASSTELVQEHMKRSVHQNFNPERAALIFEDEVGTPDWLAELIQHKEWRQLVYDLSEEHPSSLMLNYLIKLISDAGFQSEIAQISTIANHLDVFSGVLADYLASCVKQSELGLKENIRKVAAIACSSQHTYIYCQVLLHSITEGATAPILKRLAEEIHLACENSGEAARTEFLFHKGDETDVKVSLAVTKTLEAKKLTHHLRTIYEILRSESSSNSSIIEYLRFPGFLGMLRQNALKKQNLLVDELFHPHQRLKPETIDQTTYIIGYAVSIDSGDPDPSSEFMQTIHGMHEVLNALKDVEQGSLTASTSALLQEFVSYPVIARGLLHFLQVSMNNPDFLSDTFTTKNMPPHFLLLDEIGTRHPLLRDKILSLLALLCECPYSIDSMMAIDLKRKIIDRVIYVFAMGNSLQVLSWIQSLCGKTDLSLITYFISEMLAVVAPPYSIEFFRAVFPILDRSDIQAGYGNRSAERTAVVCFLK